MSGPGLDNDDMECLLRSGGHLHPIFRIEILGMEVGIPCGTIF
jgi:hypothetical protein